MCCQSTYCTHNLQLLIHIKHLVHCYLNDKRYGQLAVGFSCLSSWRTRHTASLHARILQAKFGRLNISRKYTMSCEIEPVRRSFCRRRSCGFTEVARLVPSGRVCAPSQGWLASKELGAETPQRSSRFAQPKTYPHPRIPAAGLFFVILCFSSTPKSGVGITFAVPMF